MIKILLFDTLTKCKLFQEYAGKSKFIEYYCTHDPDRALTITKLHRPEIIVIGGEMEDDRFVGVHFYNMLVEWNLAKRPRIYISSWNPDEAKLLRKLSKAFYCPFSNVLAKTIKNAALNIRKDRKKMEIARNKLKQKKKDENK